MREITLVSKGCDSNPPFLSTNLNLYSKGKQSWSWRGGQKPSLAKIMSQKGRVLVMEEEENN